MRILALFCTLALLGNLPSSSAQASDINRAVTSYKRGMGLYYQSKHRLALQYFVLSYQSLPKLKRYNRTRNALNFFIGDCHFKLGQFQEAYVRLKAYHDATYRKKQKTAQFNTAKSMLQKVCKKLGLPFPTPPPPLRRPTRPRTGTGTGTGTGTRTRVKPPQQPSQPASPSRPHPLGWVILGVGVVTVAAAVIAGVTAQNTMTEAHAEYNALLGTRQQLASSITPKAREAINQSTIANVLYAAGGGVAGLGAVLLLIWRAP